MNFDDREKAYVLRRFKKARRIYDEAKQKAIEDKFDTVVAEDSEEIVYSSIGDAVADSPEASFDGIVQYLSEDLGVSEKEFLKKYKRARRVFDEQRRNIQCIRKAERELRELLKHKGRQQ